MANHKVLKRRLKALQTRERQDQSHRFPMLVPAATPDSEIERLRARGRKVFRDDDDGYSKFVDEFV